MKDTAVRFLGEGGNIQFRWETFNLLNHPNFALPNAAVWTASSPGANPLGGPITAGGGTFPAFGAAGQITATSNKSREMQFALKFIF